MTGSLVGNIDVAQVVLYAFWLFFAGLIWYLRQEDRREGYPLEEDVSGRYNKSPWLFVPPKKTFLLPHGQGIKQVPDFKRDERTFSSRRIAPAPGYPIEPVGNPLLAGDHDRRFFEASWMHKYNGKYYFSYSTGNTHFLCYATGDNPYGPFTYQGRILEPVIGWTTHHSIAEYQGQWYLFYHDSILSKGITHLRSVKMAPLNYNADGSIQTITPYRDE